jgi:hypothetical protein
VIWTGPSQLARALSTISIALTTALALAGSTGSTQPETLVAPAPVSAVEAAPQVPARAGGQTTDSQLAVEASSRSGTDERAPSVVPTGQLTTTAGIASTPATAAAVTSRPTPAAGYLANPGIGYQGWTSRTGILDSSVEYRRGEDAAQGGFDWATINPAPGTFNWTPIDAFLAECAARAERGSFRIYTMSGAPYGTNRLPDWVIADGAIVRDTVDKEPDYRSRTYQEHWGAFVDALAARYDGDSRIAFIDISGYGRFNEWQANPYTDLGDELGDGDSIDASTRRHLVQMFVGGVGSARVLEPDGREGAPLAYAHSGFRKTQLIMPYGGLWSSTRYVARNYPEVGFRNDALFTRDADLEALRGIGYGVTDIWRRAPVVFEAAGPPGLSALAPASATLQGMGASLFHENAVMTDPVALARLVEPLGYRYTCTEVTALNAVRVGQPLTFTTTWRNTGTARAYPRMGQDFVLNWALVNTAGQLVTTWTGDESVSDWLPGEDHVVSANVRTPNVSAGQYVLMASVAEKGSGRTIGLPLQTDRKDNWYPMSTLRIRR